MSSSIATASYYVYSLRLTPPTLYDPYLMYSLPVCGCPSAFVCLHLCLSACRSIDEIPCDASLSRQRRPWFAGDMLNLRPDDNVVVGVVVVGDCDDKHDSLFSCSKFFHRPPISFVRLTLWIFITLLQSILNLSVYVLMSFFFWRCLISIVAHELIYYLFSSKCDYVCPFSFLVI